MKKFLALIAVFMGFVSFALAENAVNSGKKVKVKTAKPTKITLYQSQFCGCCGSWVKYMQEKGYEFDVIKDSEKMMNAKAQLGIADEYQSCHTGVVQGFAVEGHVPEDAVAWLLRTKPKDVIGISTPGMPLGSPGMEQGSEAEYENYPVVLMLKGGGYRIYGTYKGKELVENGDNSLR